MMDVPSHTISKDVASLACSLEHTCSCSNGWRRRRRQERMDLTKVKEVPKETITGLYRHVWIEPRIRLSVD